MPEFTAANRLERQQNYEKIRSEMARTYESNVEARDKAILTLSTALLGVSIAFVTNVVDLTTAEYKIVLVIGWVSLVLALVISVANYMLSEPLFDASNKHLEASFGMGEFRDATEPDYSHKDRMDSYNQWLTRLNRTTAISFLVGVVCLGFFFSYNVLSQTIVEQKTAQCMPADEVVDFPF